MNASMRDMLLAAQKQYRDQNMGYAHKGIMAVLNYWGDGETLIQHYMRRQDKLESEDRRNFERLHKQDNSDRKMIGYEVDDRY